MISVFKKAIVCAVLVSLLLCLCISASAALTTDNYLFRLGYIAGRCGLHDNNGPYALNTTGIDTLQTLIIVDDRFMMILSDPTTHEILEILVALESIQEEPLSIESLYAFVAAGEVVVSEELLWMSAEDDWVPKDVAADILDQVALLTDPDVPYVTGPFAYYFVPETERQTQALRIVPTGYYPPVGKRNTPQTSSIK